MPIDIHAHYVPPQLLSAIEGRGAYCGVRLLPAGNGKPPALGFDYGFRVRPFFPQLVEPVEQRRASLDRQGLDRQLVATWPDIYGYGLAKDACAHWHRMLNDTLGEWCHTNNDRFSFVASVPLVDAADAAAELDRAVDLGAVAVMVPANVEGVNIGEKPLDPFWAKAEALGLPVILHPVLVDAAPRAAKFALTQIAQYTFDTTLGIGSIIFSGVLDRFPALSIVLSHGGGTFPYLLGRFDVMHARMDRAGQGDVAQCDPSVYASRIGYDSIVHAPKALRFLADTVGIERVALGTDESFPPADRDPLASVKAAGFSAADIELITETNPRRLFPRLP
ncbi:amidohydrolase family protein [Tardiphaga sp. 172_B4_N1_3]|uniref:amidohydrolase family protein n=1 Tax=Tardiphaga sp. 172_B4_N1_3 TaxID=3240787 RepID=UPI003F8C60A8